MARVYSGAAYCAQLKDDARLQWLRRRAKNSAAAAVASSLIVQASSADLLSAALNASFFSRKSRNNHATNLDLRKVFDDLLLQLAYMVL